MKRLIFIVPLIMVLLISGCDTEGTKAGYNNAIANGETVTNPLIFEDEITERITEIVVKITTIIEESKTIREVERTTHIKEPTISAKTTDMVGIINNYRQESNISSLKISDELCEIAKIRAKEASVLWSHTRPNGKGIDSLFVDYDFRWTIVGKNLAKCENATPKDIIGAWVQSETHRANLLNEKYKFCGIAEYYDGEIRYISIILTD